MSSYLCTVFSKSPADVRDLLKPYDELDSDYYRKVYLTDLEKGNLRKQFVHSAWDKFNPDAFENFLKAMGYDYDEQYDTVSRMENPNGRWYDYRVQDSFMAANDDRTFGQKVPVAFVTESGQWNGCGTVGMFGQLYTDNEKKRRFMEDYELYLDHAVVNHLYMNIVICRT